MTPPVTRHVPVEPGVRLAADQWPGGAPAFLLVHGLASNSQLWWGAAEHLSELGHAAASVDQRGHGRSDKPDAGYTLDRACADLMAVVEDLHGHTGFDGRLIVAGQSWGANVALELGYRHPETFSGVVCVDGGTIELSARFSDWESCAQALAPPRSTGRRLSDIDTFMRQAHPDWPESGIEAQLANFELREDGTVAPLLSFEHHMELLRAMWDQHPALRYPEMKVPVLFVPADGQQAAFGRDKRASVDAAVAAIPRARAHWFSPADHDLHAQFPEELAEVLHEETLRGILA